MQALDPQALQAWLKNIDPTQIKQVPQLPALWKKGSMKEVPTAKAAPIAFPIHEVNKHRPLKPIPADKSMLGAQKVEQEKDQIAQKIASTKIATPEELRVFTDSMSDDEAVKVVRGLMDAWVTIEDAKVKTWMEGDLQWWLRRGTASFNSLEWTQLEWLEPTNKFLDKFNVLGQFTEFIDDTAQKIPTISRESVAKAFKWTPFEWMEALPTMVANAPWSLVKTATATARWLTNPFDTIVGLSKLVMTPEWRQVVIDRYGSIEWLKQAMTEDPVWLASDVLTVLQWGAWLASKWAKVAWFADEAARLWNFSQTAWWAADLWLWVAIPKWLNDAMTLADDLSNNWPLGKVGSTVIKSVVEPTQPLKTAKETFSNLWPKPSIEAANEIVWKIIQWEIKDIDPALRTLKEIDTKNVSSYDELSEVIDARGKNFMEMVDERLNKETKVIKPEDAKVTTTVWETSIIQEPVKKWLAQLKEMYNTIDDPVNEARITELERQFTKGWLSLKAINDIAREYNGQFWQKAFSKKWDPLTSVNAQAYENNRKAIKEYIRDQMSDEVTKTLDKQYSDLASTKKLVDKMNEKVNTLSQKIQKRGVVEKVARAIWRWVDFITAWGVRGFLTSFLPSNIGNKVMNALDLQESLSANLKKFDAIIKKLDNGQVDVKDMQFLFPDSIKDVDSDTNLSNTSVQQPKQVDLQQAMLSATDAELKELWMSNVAIKKLRAQQTLNKVR